jgi:transposase
MAKSPTSIKDTGKQIQALIKEVESLIETQFVAEPLKGLLLSIFVLVKLLIEKSMPKDSSNSHKPPSQDIDRDKKKKKKKKSDKPRGGQKGHPGINLRQTDNPDEVIKIPVDREKLPPGDWKAAGFVKRQQVDIEFSTKVTEYQAERLSNENGETVTAEFPKGINGPVQYGPKVRSIGTYLNVADMIPFDRLSAFFNNVFGLGVCSATLSNFRHEAAGLLDGFVDYAKFTLTEADVLHADETGINIDGNLNWVHVNASDQAVLMMPSEKRGNEGMDCMGVLENFTGTIVHDCWAPYFNYLLAYHCICCAHLLRELKGVIENSGEKWAERMHEFLLRVKKLVDDLGGCLDETSLKVLRKEYSSIIKKGEKECPEIVKPPGKRGRGKQTKARNLLLRLKEHMDSVLRFTTDESIPFTNNEAERSVRMLKVHEKVSGCFRSFVGAIEFCMIRSYLMTCKRHNIGPFEAMELLFEYKLPAFISNYLAGEDESDKIEAA